MKDDQYNKGKEKSKKRDSKHSIPEQPPALKTPYKPHGQAADLINFLQQTRGNQQVQQMIESGELHAMLRVSQANDPLEREADRVADMVVDSFSPDFDVDEYINNTFAASNATRGKTVDDLFPNRVKGLGGGKALPQTERTFFEERFGADFSGVRVYTGPTADEFARAINARAFTYRQDIVFADGEYTPGTREGRRLMAHELTHVLQGDSGIRRKAASGMINKHTSFGNLDEKKLGIELLDNIIYGKYTVVHKVLNKLSSGNKQEISYEIISCMSDYILQTTMKQKAGMVLLERIYDHVTQDKLSTEEQKHADRILRERAVSIEHFPADANSIKIFPHCTNILDYGSHIRVWRLGNGKLKVKLHPFIRVEYPEVAYTLPQTVCYDGIELDAGEIVGIKMYDEGGEILYRPALFLLQMMHQGDSVYKQRFIEAAVFGATLGMGAVVVGGIKSVTLAAKIARWADRAAAAIYLGTRVIQESRGWIIKKFGQEGKAFVHYSEILNSAAMIYGVGRVIYEMPKLVYNFGKAYKEWRAAAQMGKGLSSKEQQAVQTITQNTDEFFAVITGIEKIKGNSKDLNKLYSILASRKGATVDMAALEAKLGTDGLASIAQVVARSKKHQMFVFKYGDDAVYALHSTRGDLAGAQKIVWGQRALVPFGKAGKYKRTQTELDDLARDPAHNGKISKSSIQEREAGLGVEGNEDIPGPIKRDPSGNAEFIDAKNKYWDVKRFNSYFPPKKGGYSLKSSMRKIRKSLSEGENVIVDTRDLKLEHLNELKAEIIKYNLSDTVKFWP